MVLLVHKTGTTKIGEVCRYTITYSPSHDRLLPLPTALYLRIKNTASLPFRAAYLRGPYTLYVSVRRQEFQPWPSQTPGTAEREDVLRQESDRSSSTQEGGVPVYDPHLKAGASFYATLPIPPELIEDSLRMFRESGDERKSYEHGGKVSLDGKRTFPGRRRKSVTWIIEIISQVIFSTTATVGYEILLGRDEKCLSFGFPFGAANNTLRPETAGSQNDEVNGALSRAVTVKLQGTKELWNLPPLPSWEEQLLTMEEMGRDPDEQDEAREWRKKQKLTKKTKKVHLVILTHGLHSNTGADMLFLKESIDEEERKAAPLRREQRKKAIKEGKISPDDAEDDVEQVIVRGFHDNYCRTERGIRYLGKRLARYILHLAHPNHNPLPKSGHNKLQKPRKPHHHPHLTPAARNPPVHEFEQDKDPSIPPYKFTSISFIGHSLGGLVQTYAIAYIHAHSPNFFHEIKPVNFVTLATPFLGLSNENPIYIRFALDFGLVGKTGQDLGLTWRAPSAFSFSGNASAGKAVGPGDHSSKPLLRILPTGPAHEVLKMFRNRTVYANVVNDGIVPLRTSCLLFLDWKGLGRVEKARRENGPVGGLVEWGWGQLVTNGGMSSKTTPTTPTSGFSLPSAFGTTFWGKNEDSAPSPLIPTDGAAESSDAAKRLEEQNPIGEAPLTSEPTERERTHPEPVSPSLEPFIPTSSNSSSKSPNPFSSIMTLLRLQGGPSKTKPAGKIYHRSQTQSTTSSTADLQQDSGSSSSVSLTSPHSPANSNDLLTPLEAPPRTSILEAAGDVLNPPLPTTEFIIDPTSRPRTIFHDRVYHAPDIPSQPPTTSSGIPVEEKIARAYHKDLSWRKVLVSLKPDAHNNMVVRRMFANAYGWPVVQHVVETHFGASYEAATADDDEPGIERAPTPPPPPSPPPPPRSTGTSWTSDAFLCSDEDEEMDDVDDDDVDDDGIDGKEEAVLEFLGLPSPPPPPEAREEGLVGVSRVYVEGVAGGGGGGGGGGVGTAVGLGLRNLSLGPTGEGAVRSEAVRMLERCNSGGGGGGSRSRVPRSAVGSLNGDREEERLLA